MDANELRAAAERCLNPDLDVYDRAKAGNVVARAYLAEHPADDGEPVTSEWLMDLPGCVVDPASTDSVLIQIDGNRYVVVEHDLSIAIQEGMYTERDSQYIALPHRANTRGDVRRLCAALGFPARPLPTPPPPETGGRDGGDRATAGDEERPE